ncbi:MAG: hypothetical protein KBA66_05740 [Leptospiraceae bacterium]|nr:hypothetical protein [Leptospiraceae bacterium]
MKLQNKLIVKITILGLAFVILIKWLGIEKRAYLSSELLCPSFGNLPTLQIPKNAILIDPIDSTKRVGVRNRNGEKKFYPLEYVDGALFIRSHKQLREYLSVYADICGGKPAFYNSIDYVKLDRLRKIETKRQEIAKNKMEQKEWGNFYAKEKRLKTDKTFLENRISTLENKLERITPVSFKIIGKVAEKTKDSLIVFGSAIPDISGAKETAGFVHNGVLVLRNSKKSDIVSPDYYEAKHVLTKDFYFIKRIDGRDTFGHYMPVSVYDRNVKVTSPKTLSDLKKEISTYKNKLLFVEKELKNMERMEEQLIAGAM